MDSKKYKSNYLAKSTEPLSPSEKTFVKEELDKYRPNERRFQVTFDHPDILSEESEDREITK